MTNLKYLLIIIKLMINLKKIYLMNYKNIIKITNNLFYKFKKKKK